MTGMCHHIWLRRGFQELFAPTGLLISASPVARIIGMSHRCLAKIQNFLSTMLTLRETQILWCTSVIPAIGRLKQEEFEFKASLGYIVTVSQN
jgi:hypothetical protein